MCLSARCPSGPFGRAFCARWKAKLVSAGSRACLRKSQELGVPRSSSCCCCCARSGSLCRTGRSRSSRRNAASMAMPSAQSSVKYRHASSSARPQSSKASAWLW
eukprot:989742-Pyramimonas_sp.AAC.1